jgi:hypothetical protein
VELVELRRLKKSFWLSLILQPELVAMSHDWTWS